MPVDLPAIIEARHRGKRRARRRGRRTMPPVEPRATDEVWLRRKLDRFAREAATEIEGMLADIARQIDATAASDALVVDRDPTKKPPKVAPRRRQVRPDRQQVEGLAYAVKVLEARVVVLDRVAQQIAEEFAGRVERSHRKRFFARLKAAASVDLEEIIAAEGLGTPVAQAIESNVALIKSIPEEQLGRVRELVDGVVLKGEAPEGGMRAELQRIGGISRRRAQFIARDQTAKLNARLNETRNLAIGIVEYEWRATGGKSGDGRTRKSHREKHGQVYRWDSPPPDTGHPGEDYQCRCTARSIIPD